MTMKKAKYVEMFVEDYIDNPCIEALDYPLTKKQLMATTECRYKPSLDLTRCPDHYKAHALKSHIINSLLKLYVMRDEAFEIYTTIRQLIESGYAHRSPISANYKRMLVELTENIDKPISKLNFDIPRNRASSLIGLSGTGKTSLVKSILKQLPNEIYHNTYKDSNGKTHRINHTQIVYLYIEVYERRSKKDFLEDLLEEISAKVNIDYIKEFKDCKATLKMNYIRKLSILYNIGLIVIDEGQNFSKITVSSDNIPNNERISQQFIEEVFNVIGIPLYFVGTFKMFKLFSSDLTIGRRTCTDGSHTFLTTDINSSFWKRLVIGLCRNKFMDNQTTTIEDLTIILHEITCGIPAIASDLVRITLIYLAGLAPKNQDLSKKALKKIFSERFQALEPAIMALKRNDYYKFEDLKPLVTLKEMSEINESESLKESRTTSRNLTNNTYNNTAERAHEASDSITPKNITNIIGHNIDQ